MADVPEVVLEMIRKDLAEFKPRESGALLYGIPLQDILGKLTPDEQEGLFVWMADRMKKEGIQEGRSQGFLNELQSLGARASKA